MKFWGGNQILYFKQRVNKNLENQNLKNNNNNDN